MHRLLPALLVMGPGPQLDAHLLNKCCVHVLEVLFRFDLPDPRYSSSQRFFFLQLWRWRALPGHTATGASTGSWPRWIHSAACHGLLGPGPAQRARHGVVRKLTAAQAAAPRHAGSLPPLHASLQLARTAAMCTGTVAGSARFQSFSPAAGYLEKKGEDSIRRIFRIPIQE